MRNNIILSSALLLLSVIVAAQNKSGKISGLVQDGSGKPLQSISISLLKAKDSTLAKIAVSGKDGVYEFINIADGNYLVSVSSIGFERKFSPVFQLSAGAATVKLEPLQMQAAVKSMGEVTVTAKKPFIESRIDKTIVNVESSPASAGSSALEILEKSPGVTVDNDGNISLKGKAGVIIMLDGKPTYLASTDLANLLKNMPASALEQIEIMTNPSSKYDASGNSGVINIKTKKGRAAGFNGSVMTSITAGIFKPDEKLYIIPKTQNSFNFNYRKKKINIFGNYNPNIFRGRGNLVINRKFIDDNSVVNGYSDVLTNFKFGNNNHTLKLGMDLFANEKNTFGVVMSGFIFSGHPTPVTTTTISDANHTPLSSLVSLTENKIRFKNLSSNFNFRHVFDTTGTELTADLDYVGYNSTSNMLLTTDFYNAGGQSTANTLLLKGHLPSDINIISVKSDYTHPFKKGGRLEAGFKSSFVKNNNLVEYDRQVADKWVKDARSNHFIYDENINALYVNVNRQVNKWSLQGGLRMENTVAKGYQVTNDSTFRRNFTSLFPSVFVSYEVNKSNTFTISYSRRITRPNYQDLNPFTYFLDSLSYRKGNPFLLPQYTQKFELSHSFKGKLITTVNYDNTTDVISQILKQDIQSKIVYFTADNVARFTNMGISFTAPLPLKKWWNANFFANIYNNHYRGIYNAAPLDVSYTSFTVNISNTFTIKPGFSLELSGFYRAKGVDQLNISQSIYQLNLGGQKNIMKGKATVRMSIRDPFAWQVYRAVTRYNTIDVNFRQKFDARQVTASFTYRFGKNNQQNPPPRRRNSATQDEQNRVGQGGQ